jgi:hypothetical protein
VWHVVGDVLLAIAVVALVGAGVTTWRLMRSIRRQWRRLRTGEAAPRITARVASTAARPQWWAMQHDRHRMWRAVSSAEHAVGAAVKAQAGVGDLPSLARRLRRAATQVDAALSAACHNSGRVPTGVRDEHALVMASARDVERLAIQVTAATAGTSAVEVRAAVLVEERALAAGMAAATAAGGDLRRRR